MKHQGKALGAAAAMLSKSVLVCLFLAAFFSLAWPKSLGLGALMAFLGFIFGVFVLWFFRDPDPRVPSEDRVVVSPAHGKVDVIDELEEPEVMGGRCRRISIFLSVFDVHVQNSPVSGIVHHLKHTPGKFLNALNTDSASHNENVLVGFQLPSTGDGRVGIRLIAGLIARRIIPWVRTGESVARGERISLIQFGSRVDVYLPLTARIEVGLGQRVRGGETVVARLG